MERVYVGLSTVQSLCVLNQVEQGGGKAVMFAHIDSPCTFQRETSDYTTVSSSSLSLAQITGMQLLPISQNVLKYSYVNEIRGQVSGWTSLLIS